MDADLYEILQVSPNAEPEVIDSAYRRLARMYHPDVSRSAEATERMRAINEAYEVLRDPSKRTAYDRTRGASRSQRPPPRREPPQQASPAPTAVARKRWISGALLTRAAVVGAIGVMGYFSVYGFPVDRSTVSAPAVASARSTATTRPAAPTTPPTLTAAQEAAEEHVDAARDYIGAGQLGLALVELDQALSLGPHRTAQDLRADMGARATATVEAAARQGAATAEARAQATMAAAASATAVYVRTQATAAALTTALAVARVPEWVPVTQFTGTGPDQSPPFLITGRQWRARWFYAGSGRFFNLFELWAEPVNPRLGGPFSQYLGTSSAGQAGSNTVAASGQWYLSVRTASGPWQVQVDELR